MKTTTADTGKSALPILLGAAVVSMGGWVIGVLSKERRRRLAKAAAAAPESHPPTTASFASGGETEQ